MMVPSSSSQPPDAAKTKNNNDNKLTRLDRSLALILEKPDQTPSRNAGITPEVERLHRFHGISILFESSRGLSLGPSTCATACTIFHRFYHSCSLTEYNVWSVALASTLLATKVEEDAKNLKQIIEEYNRIYARRLVLAELQLDQGEPTLSSTHLECLNNAISKWPDAKQRQRICADRLPQQLNKHGPVYKEWHQEITRMESVLLRQLGFTFYWISDSHPHKFLLDFCRALELDDNKEFTQRAWNYCNDSCWLDLCVRHHPEIIASSTIYLAARDFDIELPMTPIPWWQVFLGSENSSSKGKDLADVANAILGTCNPCMGMEPQEPEANDKAKSNAIDWVVATKGFLRSLEVADEGKTFNSSDSFVWFNHKEFFEKENQSE